MLTSTADKFCWRNFSCSNRSLIEITEINQLRVNSRKTLQKRLWANNMIPVLKAKAFSIWNVSIKVFFLISYILFRVVNNIDSVGPLNRTEYICLKRMVISLMNLITAQNVVTPRGTIIHNYFYCKSYLETIASSCCYKRKRFFNGFSNDSLRRIKVSRKKIVKKD